MKTQFTLTWQTGEHGFIAFLFHSSTV